MSNDEKTTEETTTNPASFQDKAINTINAHEARWLELLNSVESIVSIESDAEALEATNLLKECNNFLNEVEKQRKAITDPLQKFIKELIALATKVSKWWESAKELLKKKILDYNNRLEQKRVEEEKRIQKEQADIASQALQLQVVDMTEKEKADLANAKTPEEVKRIQNEIELRKFKEQKQVDAQKQEITQKQEELQQKQAVSSSNFSASAPKGTYKVKVFTIVDPTKVPRAYCTVDESLIRQAVNGGITHIDGVEIKEETRVK